VCIVTGAASGIGRAVADALRAEGAVVAGLDLRPSTDAWSIPCDVADAASVTAAVDEVVDGAGSVDVLVNAAGIHRAGTVADISPEAWDEVLAVDLRGAFLTSRAVLPGMMANGSGAIVHIASAAGLLGGRGSAAYVAAKGGLIALTRAMALDHAGHGVRVNCVCPGMVRTPMLEATEAGLSAPERLALEGERAQRHPLGRIGRTKDIVPAVLYLASDDAAWVTGAVLPVDGGWSAGLP
jgi:NAD(P)-dependent dehydrogenase (short-subunit alcohol dehydrogenase family)